MQSTSPGTYVQNHLWWHLYQWWRCSGERWEGKATIPSAFLPANVSAFNMFAIHKATPIEQDQVSCVICQNAEYRLYQLTDIETDQARANSWKSFLLCVSDLMHSAPVPIILFQKFIDKSFYFEAWEDGKIYEALFPVEEVRGKTEKPLVFKRKI